MDRALSGQLHFPARGGFARSRSTRLCTTPKHLGIPHDHHAARESRRVCPHRLFQSLRQDALDGRCQSDFSGAEVVELLQFCESEGCRWGHNDAIQDRIGTSGQAPFHEAFLGGYPKQVWENAYWDGVNSQCQLLELGPLGGADFEGEFDGFEQVHTTIETDQQLIAALPLENEFGVSRVQRLTRWGYNQASQKLKQLASQKLIIQVEGEPNRYVMAPTKTPQHNPGAVC